MAKGVSAPGGCLTMAEVEHVLEVRNVIGEGPLWHSQEGCLYWVNFIEQFNILRFSPREGWAEPTDRGYSTQACSVNSR
jgi:sugar lactone lactonase YvrE